MQFPKCYLLDTNYNPWRTEVVQQRFKDAGLDVERYAGVHGQTVGVMPCRTVWDAERENPYRINPGKMSITISKMLLYEKILNSPDEVVIIFENDVKFVDNFKEEFAVSVAKLPDDWEVCHIGWCCIEGKPITIVNDRISEISWPLCCHAIMFKKHAIQMAMETFKRSDWGTPSDTILQHGVYPKLRHYCMTPALAFPDNTDSEAAKTECWTDVQGWFDWSRIYDEQLTGFGRNKAVVVEIGAWKGRSTIYMAEEIKRRHKKVDFYAVDTWEGNPDEPDMQELIKDANSRGGLYQEFIRNINRCGVADYIKPLRMTSVEAAAKFKDGELNFFFLDAGHSYEAVMADMEAWWPKLHFNASCAGHDIHRPEVRRALTDFCKKVGKKFREWDQCWIIDAAHRQDM